MRTPFLLLAIILVAGCQSSKILNQDTSTPTEYSIIYVIHGDANYLYHNADGKALQADEEVLKEAKVVGRKAKNGEVFIFHQNPENKVLWLFPKKDRQFLYYRNGKQIASGNYSPQSDKKSFTKEAQLYKKISQSNLSEPHERIFLYFGHEIPESSEGVYHYSRSDVPLDTQTFASGIQSFLPQDDSLFNLTVLSTCNNGTPSMIHALEPFSQFVLASPQNLHLSHMDTGALPSLLEEDNIKTKEIANTLADNTYQRLSGFLQTAITLSVYDTQEIAPYLTTMTQQYNRYLKTVSKQNILEDNGDCAELPFLETGDIQQGVQTWYKPPRFGQKDKSSTHSGWGCAQK